MSQALAIEGKEGQPQFGCVVMFLINRGLRLLFGSLLIVPVLISRALGQTSKPVAPWLPQGAVVQSVMKNSESERAGLRSGDILLSWQRGRDQGLIDSPFDLTFLRFEEATRGPFVFHGISGTRKRSWVMGPGLWGIFAVPDLRGELLAVYQQGQDFERVGERKKAVESWRRCAALSQKLNVSWLSSWFLTHGALSLYNAAQWEEAYDEWKQAIQLAANAGPTVKAEISRQLANAFQLRRDFANAERYYGLALAEWLKVPNGSMAVSAALRQLGAMMLDGGEAAQAERYFRKALRNAQGTAPTSIEIVWILTELADALVTQGDLAGAEDCLRKALALEEFSSRNEYSASTLAGLGVVAHERGDLASAETYFKRALALAKKFDPNSQTEATIEKDLWDCLLAKGDPIGAEVHDERALSLWQKLNPGGVEVAVSHADLGELAGLRNDLDQAEKCYREALSITDALDPAPYQVAFIWAGLGKVNEQRGELTKAQENYRRALEISRKAAPGNAYEPAIIGDLAEVTRRLGQSSAAAELYRQAIHALEIETGHLGGIEEDRSRFRAVHTKYYKQYADLLLEQGKSELALEVVEGSRARTLLEMLTRSNINIRGTESTLIRRERESGQRLNAAMQRRIRWLSEKHNDQDLPDLDRHITNLRDDYERIEAQIRAETPEYAALTQPRPLSAGEIQQLLDPETVLLEYSLGEQRSYVWLVTANSIYVRELPGRDEIERMARHFYSTLTTRAHPVGDAKTKALNLAKTDALSQKLAWDLSRAILAPVADFLDRKRLLIVGDGALQYVPFAALPEPGTKGVPLVLQHEIVNLPSASVLAEIRRAGVGRPLPSGEVAVVADPVFDAKDDRVSGATHGVQPATALMRTNRMVRRSAWDVGLAGRGDFYLPRLLYTREEARAIRAVIPHKKTREALDFNASRATAISSELAGYRIVHFATHGFLDSKHPALSGLVLSLVNRRGEPQDGFLGLEDIFNLKLPVELVVLSACETALGKEINGEGLVGLTRGFMYAGASRVVASLWNVSDVATAKLMKYFYQAIEQDHLPPAAALRQAQIQLSQQKRWHNPYYWAAFQIQGEWK